MVPSLNRNEEDKMKDIANRMEELLEEFMNWDVKTDPKGFLERAKTVMNT